MRIPTDLRQFTYVPLFNPLSVIFDNDDWRQKVEATYSTSRQVGVKHPTLFGLKLSLLLEITYVINEIVIIGSNFYDRLKEVLTTYFPYLISMAAEKEKDIPILQGKKSNGRTLTYLGKIYAYQKPVQSVAEFKTLPSTNFLRKNTIIV